MGVRVLCGFVAQDLLKHAAGTRLKRGMCGEADLRHVVLTCGMWYNMLHFSFCSGVPIYFGRRVRLMATPPLPSCACPRPSCSPPPDHLQ